MKLKALACLFIFSFLVLAGCSQQPASPPAGQPAGTQPPSAQPPSTEPPATTPPAATTASVSIKNFAFSPAELTVAKGTKVVWTNEDSAPHTIASDTFSSGSLSNGGKFEFVFSEAGTFDYICGLHPSMK